MLGIHVYALCGCTFDLSGAELAGKETILSIVFKVSPGERSTMNIHARSIQSNNAVGNGFRAEHPAEFLDQFHIPGRADHGFAGEGHTAQGADKRVDARRSVQIRGGRLAHAVHSGRRPAAV